METIVSDANHLDASVLLPPRKRLLAGLKRQSCSQSMSQCSHEHNQSLSPSSQTVPLTEFDIRLNNLLRCYKNGSNMSPEEIAKAAGSEAIAAAKLAEAARAAAEEKAFVAAKAVSVAKIALDLVASMSEDMGGRDKQRRKNKSEKQVPVQVLYKNYQPFESCGKDEDLARRLHRVINSSHRVSKTCPDSDMKGHRHKKLKIPPTNDAIETGVGCKCSNEETLSVKMVDKMWKSSKCDEIEVNSSEVKVKSSPPKEKASRSLEDICINGRKRGRIKQKKLPLSLCSFKDQGKPKEPNVKKSLFSRARDNDKSTTHHVSSGNVNPVEVAPTWKCHDSHVAQCVKQDKMVQS